MSKGRNFLSLSKGVKMVLLARNISLEAKNLDIALGRGIAYRSLVGKKKKPTIVSVPSGDHDGIDGLREGSLLRLDNVFVI